VSSSGGQRAARCGGVSVAAVTGARSCQHTRRASLPAHARRRAVPPAPPCAPPPPPPPPPIQLPAQSAGAGRDGQPRQDAAPHPHALPKGGEGL
jgi:hypothetical protein